MSRSRRQRHYGPFVLTFTPSLAGRMVTVVEYDPPLRAGYSPSPRFRRAILTLGRWTYLRRKHGTPEAAAAHAVAGETFRPSYGPPPKESTTT